jgi:uncharacterized membrane protein
MITKFNRHKNKIAILALLVSASAISIALVIARIVTSDTFRYGFLIWNLILAWVPLIFARMAYYFASTRKPGIYILTIASGIVWFMFFPNALYILTDFQHIATVDRIIPVWYDVLMLAWCSWTGILIGIVSLYTMQELVTRASNKWVGWSFSIIVISMSSFGVYIGRFLRWNSWDVWSNPAGLLHDIFLSNGNPLTQPRTMGFTVLFTFLFLFIYITLYVFGHFQHEQRA